MIAVLIVLTFVAGAAVLIAGRALGRWIFGVALVPQIVALVLLAAQVPRVLDGRPLTTSATWVSGLSLSISFRLDGFALLMALLVMGIGIVVLVYSWGYFAGETSGRVVRFVGYFSLFAGSMLGLVVADDVFTLYIFWELTSVLSFLLIGLDDETASVRAAAQRALLVTVAGGLAMLGGLICLVHEAGTADLQGVLAAAPTSTLAQVGLVLVLVGAFTKSAQVPFHFWLPGAMAAPTPVSAYLHSATMVKAGVILVARFAPAFADLGWWRPLLVIVGGASMLAGGVAALRRDDAKQALAFGTVSQLGLLMVLFGMGTPETTAAAIALLVAHVIFKSGLFLTIGAVEHATGSRSMSALNGVGRSLPVLASAAGLCTLSMIGVPPLLGFAAKESALAALYEADDAWLNVALVVVVVGSMLTAAYSIRIWWGVFASKVATDDAATVHHRPGPSLVAPVGFLGVLSLVGGLAASALGSKLAEAAKALDQVGDMHLTMWPGLHIPLLLSVIIVAVGTVIAVVVIRSQFPSAATPTIGERAYTRTYEGLLHGARRLTVVTQSGSLPVYVAVIFTVVFAAVAAALIAGAGDDLGDPVFADSALQAAFAVLGIVMAMAVVTARRRFVSVLLLGGVGQAMTVIFLMYGAPDLALTQFMIETLTIVAFLLVLRHLPHRYSAPPSWAPRAFRVGLSLVVGVGVAWFALAAGSVDRPTDVADTIEELSLPEAGGKNVVNVTIVDFRGVDTMFEITVFGVAALGVANLVAGTRRRGDRRSAPRLARIGAQSMIFEQVTRMIFHLTLLVSVYVALRGHNAPGGGFAGGLIAGAAFAFRLLAGGGDEKPLLGRVSPVVLIATGILMATGSGIGGLIAGNEFLETTIFHVSLPIIGDIKLVSAGIFDLGVYVLVIGVVIVVLGNLAARTQGGGTTRDAGTRERELVSQP